MVLEHTDIHMKKKNLDIIHPSLDLILASKINPKWIKVLNVKCKCKEFFKPNNKKMNNSI